MTKLLWRLLFSFLLPGVEDDGTAPEETTEDETPEEGDEPEEGESPEEGEDAEVLEDDEPAKPVSRAQRTIIATRERAQKAERDLAAANAALAEARRGPAQPQMAAQPSELQRIIAQEDAALANPELEPWQKYAIESRREARTANNNSQAALHRAEDLADLTRFESIGVTKPKVFAAYKDRVEALLKEHRSQGRNPPRDGLLKLLLGEDALNGKLKAEKPTPSGARRAAPVTARSDVSASGGGRMSEADKRAKRLEGKFI